MGRHAGPGDIYPLVQLYSMQRDMLGWVKSRTDNAYCVVWADLTVEHCSIDSWPDGAYLSAEDPQPLGQHGREWVGD